MWPRYSRCDRRALREFSFVRGVLPEAELSLDTAGENIVAAIETARGPDSLMIPIPPRPPGVAIAAIVELSIFIAMANVAFACYFLEGK